MTLIEQLADWVLGFDFDRLSETAVRHAKLLLLDSIGCGLAALQDEEDFRAVVRLAEELGGKPECTILGSSVKTSAPVAALANGALIRALDLNDAYWGPNRGGHPSDNMATVLAAAERSGSAGRAVIEAIVAGYEIDGRIRDIGVRDGDFDYVTYIGLAAAATAGRLLGLDRERLADALGLAATYSPALGVVRGGHISAAKWLGSGLAGHTGVLAALLAAQGLSGPRNALDDEHGWAHVVMPGADLSRLVAPAEKDFRIEHASIKAYPSVMTSQAAIAATLQARAELKGDPKQIERVDARMADIPMVRSHVANPQRRYPASRETADHSLQFLVAVALLDGELTPRQFEGHRWRDPEVLAVMDRIHIELDPALARYADTFPCWVRLILRSGESSEADVPYAPGHHHGGGMTAESVGAKFDVCAPGRSAVKAFVLALEVQADVRPLMALVGS
jgi:2-methylcitrate dehydratase